MYFRGFAIGILEDGEELREYCLQAKNTKTTTGQSYAIDEKTSERKYCPITVYAVVKDTGKRFEIRYSAKMASEDNPIIAIVYVDGMKDYTYRGLTSSSPQVQSSFWNSSRDKKYCFSFSEISQSKSPESSPNSRARTRSLYGAYGTVSVYFYKGLKVSARLTSTPYYNLNQPRIIEPKFKSEIKFTTNFDEILNEDISSKPIIDTINQSNDPIAVLHIHYRSEPWLISIGMPIRNYENSENSSTECTQNNGSFKPIQTIIDRNELDSSLDSSEVVGVQTTIQNIPSINNNPVVFSRISDQMDRLKILIQSFEKLSSNGDSHKGICDNNMNTTEQKSLGVEIPDDNNKNTNTDIRFENFASFGSFGNFGEENPKKRKRRLKNQRKRERKRMAQLSKKQPPKKRPPKTQPPEKRITQSPITQTLENLKQENVSQEIKKFPENGEQEMGVSKYREYVKREYHTSDYIEFSDNDQVLKKKTYCIEKTIIDLED